MDQPRRCRQCRDAVPKGRRTFCGPQCVHEFKIRHWQSYAAQHVRRRDCEVCSLCGMDCRKLYRILRRTRRARQTLMRMGLKTSWPRRLWEADHIIPRAEGGGLLGLENLRTLCLWCHRAQTAQLMSRLKTRQAS
ncbi:MAG TPA: HNH endonuclease [Phycisphaerae bacterium]|jgi:5-methylcytosine-specific restriction endonuclease McrA